jgi:uncharacterized protein YjdB
MPYWTKARRVAPWRALIRRAIVGVVLLEAACGGDGASANNPLTCTVSGVAVSANQATVNIGVAATLTAAVSGTAACTGRVTWSASPSGGATLTPNGLTAKFSASVPGTYTITATSGDDPTKSGAAMVTVIP